MARPLRIEYEGAVYHVTSRGNAGAEIFLEDVDRMRFLEVLASTVERFGWICHAYCLMTNHYHLLVETPEPNLSRGMQHLNGVYTQWFNRQHSRFGHLVQGRFKSIVVEKESYLLELARYIVLNPFRGQTLSFASICAILAVWLVRFVSSLRTHCTTSQVGGTPDRTSSWMTKIETAS